jgi:tubulin polyglutamylase TTLL6/13
LDHKFKPWLLEINHTPSFRTDTPLDKKIKKGLIKDSLRIMNITTKWKKKILKRELMKK